MFRQLFDSLQSGDKKGFDAAFPACYEKLRYLAYGLMKNSEDARDAVNEVFEKILSFHRDGRLTEVKDPDGWVVTVTRNHCLSRLKVVSNRARIVRENVEPHLTETTSGEVMLPLIIGDIQNCLDASFTPREASVWRLLTVEYMDRPEICEQLGISDNRLRAYFTEIKRKVKKCIGK